MAKVIIHSHAEFEQYIGQELGVSEYLKIDQERIGAFADATIDHQWIHIDSERATKEGGFGSTIAHGYLTLSLLPYLWEQIAEINNIKMMINYGIEKLKFNQPVKVNQEVRLRVKLSSLADLRGITKCQLNVKLEIKDNPKPAFTGEFIFLYHFKK
ncbi:MaoC family dehydratase [Roseivirga sp.]|uniref:MaoC family dehydratase n=1 Tax=Roseivirga sp. TaxID=1964215 RepID=UPI003B8CC1B3